MNLARRAIAVLGFLVLVSSGLSAAEGQTRVPGTKRFVEKLRKHVQHIIIVYQENWSFDGLYGKFPGADGLANAHVVQLDRSGKPLNVLPQPSMEGVPDGRFPPANGDPPLPAAPYDLTRYVLPDQKTGDLVHRFYHEQLQIDGGKMDKFVAWSDNGGLVLSYLDATDLPEGRLAQQYVLCDNFFHSVFGGSFVNHHFLIAAAPPNWPHPPSDAISNPDPANLRDALVTPSGAVVNTVYSVNSPHPKVPPEQLLPQQTHPTIGDRLGDAHISWKWYSGGWDDAIAGHPDHLFQFHHQPFVYYDRYKDGSQERREHLRDEAEFFADLKAGRLPSVSFIKPLGPDNEHPGYASVLQGQQHVAGIVAAVQSSPIWKDTVIIITYDENGGRWDHVAPPKIDEYGPGTRVPTIIVSPFAKRHFVDHAQYETLSIIKLIELRYGLQPLTQRDANANPLTGAFEF